MDASKYEERVRTLHAEEISQRAIARQLGISRRTVGRILQRMGQGSPPPPVNLGNTAEARILHRVVQKADLPPGGQPRPSSEIGRAPSDAPTTPSNHPPQESGRPPMAEDRQDDAADVSPEIAAPLQVEALPHIARQLHDGVLRFCQFEAQQVRDVEMRARQAEEVQSRALQALQAVRAEQWKMKRDVTQSSSEILQTTGQLLQVLLRETD
jgi:Homeodomain-like domain